MAFESNQIILSFKYSQHNKQKINMNSQINQKSHILITTSKLQKSPVTAKYTRLIIMFLTVQSSVQYKLVYFITQGLQKTCVRTNRCCILTFHLVMIPFKSLTYLQHPFKKDLEVQKHLRRIYNLQQFMSCLNTKVTSRLMQ